MAAPNKIIGTTQRYEVEKTIASGAFSRVYRCRAQSTGQRYAAKVVSKTVVEKFHMEESLQREADAMRRIGPHCPHVVTFVDAFVSPHNYYFIMGLAEGGTLLDYARSARKMCSGSASGTSPPGVGCSTALQPAAVAADELETIGLYTKQLLLGLQSIHACNVVHRDIKPENLLLNKSKTRLMISDFGFACYAPEGQALHRACGTLRYCAPELLEEDPSYDGRKVDVWATGVTVYLLLFKTHPYKSAKSPSGKAEADDFLAAIRQTDFTLPKVVPSPVEDFLRRALCKDPAERWTVSQLLEHLWMTSVDLASLTGDEDDTAHDMGNVSRTTASSLEPAALPRPASMNSFSSSSAVPRRHSTWDSFLEVDDGFYDVSQFDQSRDAYMSDGQEYSVLKNTATRADGRSSSQHKSPPIRDVEDDELECDSQFVSSEWVAAGSGRVHAMGCVQGGQHHPRTILGRALRLIQVTAVTLWSLFLYTVGRVCHTHGLTWGCTPNADDHFGAVDAAIAAERRTDGADENDFDAVFDSIFDGNFFGDALSGFSAGPRLQVASDDERHDAHTRQAIKVSTADEAALPAPCKHRTSKNTPPSLLEVLSPSLTQESDVTNTGDEDDHISSSGRTPHDKEPDGPDRTPHSNPEDAQPSDVDVPYSPSAPMPFSKTRRGAEDFPAILSPHSVPVHD